MADDDEALPSGTGGGDLFAGLSMVAEGKDKKVAEEDDDRKPAAKNLTGIAKDSPTKVDTKDPVAEDVHPPIRVTRAPVTDKLLALMGEKLPPPETAASTNTDTVASPSPLKSAAPDSPKATKPPAVATMPSPSTDTSAVAAHVTESPIPTVSPIPTESRRRQKPLVLEEDAFHIVTGADIPKITSSRRRVPGAIHPDTPIPNSDAALRLLRKFASKTRPQVATSQGGTKNPSLLGYLFGSPARHDDPRMQPYAQLMETLFPTDGDDDEKKSNDSPADSTVDSILGQDGDDMSRARLAIAAFCHMLSVWCHDRSEDASKASPFLALGMDAANALVAHGCMDQVQIGISEDSYSLVVNVMCESIFVADLSQETTELAALKFLLTTGCRSTTEGEALLRGTHLLQAIRILYHVYLTTDSKHNKTTARAALQQLVTSVFARMIRPQSVPTSIPTEEGFPSPNHRDAFLVLRSMCKLSMRTLPDHGLQGTGSSVTWDSNGGGGSPRKGDDEGDIRTEARPEQPHPMMTRSVHPALESKVLALELLLYVLQHTDMSGAFLQSSGPQFQYAIRNYLCVSLLKNCTSDNTSVVTLSLRLFVPLIRNFRSHLKTEIEAFVTNVFFVILESKNSTMEHKIRVVILFEQICSDPTTLAEIFLNYDCDLSAVDLFHRIVNTLSKVAKTDIDETKGSGMHFVAGAGAARMEKMRNEQRELRLYAMRALRQVLASLHASMVQPMTKLASQDTAAIEVEGSPAKSASMGIDSSMVQGESGNQSLVQIYDSKKKRRQEESEAILRFNQKPAAGIAYAAKCGHIDGTDPVEVAGYLWKNKDVLEKTQIGEYLGREVEYQNGFSLRVLHAYVNTMDFAGLPFDDAIRYYLSGFRLPGEAQKIDRIMEKFAERYTNQNPTVFPTADAAFILAFSIIMLNTDLHNPAIKEERRMTKEGFIRNNRGICDGQDLPQELLSSIFDRIKLDPISLKEDDEARERFGANKKADGTGGNGTGASSALSPAVFFSSHYDEMDRTREHNFLKERDQIVRTTETLLRRKRQTVPSNENGKSHNRPRSGSHGKLRSSVKFLTTVDTGLRDEYVTPMFEVTWAPALAAFSTAMESANGTMGALLSIATDDELELAAENAAETIEVCLTGFRLAICTAGLCGNETARDAFMLALSRFSQLGSGALLEPRHIRCIQTLLTLGRDDGELLGNTWEHIFKALSEIHRFHQVFQLMARNDRVAAARAERRRQRLEAHERRRQERERRRQALEADESREDASVNAMSEEDLSASDVSSSESEGFSDDDNDYVFEEEMDTRAIDEANARAVYDAVSESLIDAIYQRSSSLSGPSIKDFVFQLCRVSRMEISGYGGHVGSQANTIDLTQVHYRQQHTLLTSSRHGTVDHHNQPNIYNLQKLVEVTHYNMDSRPHLIFAEIWVMVAGHLTSTALHSNAAVAMYAVDSFRQLSTQYLQREELGVFEFQRRFLKPFETVMTRSELVSTKELLLKCVERIIFMFGSSNEDEETSISSDSSPSKKRHLGTLRSGWRPVVSVLGIAGHDANEGIARMGFNMLTGQLRQCLSVEKSKEGHDKPRAGVLLAERFIDLVDALLMYVSGPHEDMSIDSIDHLVTLTTFLADETFALPRVRRRPSLSSSNAVNQGNEITEGTSANYELELWWPILLGLSRSIGDTRKTVRLKSLVTLFGIINQHFFPASLDKDSKKEGKAESPKHGDLQTLQLIFRGILTPVLEHAETDVHFSPNPQLPSDFVRFITKSPVQEDATEGRWLETTFNHFMDGCVAICMRSMEIFNDDMLVEEIFAILNTCLLSDSGLLAVRGLKRLEQFLMDDLGDANITDDTWATVSHMLRRCLFVRGLPEVVALPAENGSSSASGPRAESTSAQEDKDERKHQHEEMNAMEEFVLEDSLLSDRRYIGSNATMVIGSLLINERYSSTIGLRWRLFLVGGLGQGILDWARAGAILDGRPSNVPREISGPPHYLENAVYGRMLMNRLLLQLVSMTDVRGYAHVESDNSEQDSAGVRANRSAAAYSLIEEQTKSLLSEFLIQEARLASRARQSWTKSYVDILTALVKQLVEGFNRLDDNFLFEMPWLCPTLSTCIQSGDPSVRQVVHTVVQRVFNGTVPNGSGTQTPRNSPTSKRVESI